MNKMVEIAYLLLAVVLCGCTFGDEPGVCPYTTRLDYWYAGNSSENMLPVYVDNLRQYLFDERGNLLSVVALRGDTICREIWKRVTILSFSGATWQKTAVMTWMYSR